MFSEFVEKYQEMRIRHTLLIVILAGKEKAPVKKRPISSVFNLDSDEDEEGTSAPVHLQRNSFKGMKRQAKIDIQRALEVII